MLIKSNVMAGRMQVWVPDSALPPAHHTAVVHTHHAAAAATAHQATRAPHPAVARHTSTTTAHHTSTSTTAHHTTTQRGGDIHLHLNIAAGAVVNQITPGHGHDPKAIADEVTKRTGAALGHHLAAALQRNGLLPSTTRPTLHQLGTP